MPPVGHPRRLSSTFRLVAAFALVVPLLVLVPGPAPAAPKQDAATVQKKVDALGMQVAKLAEKYDQARIELTAAKKRSAALAKQARTQEANVERLRKRIAALATSAYVGGPSDLASIVTAKTPQDVIDRATSLDQISRQDTSQIAAFQRATARLSSERAAAARALASQRKVTARIGHTRSTILAALGKQKRLLTRLKDRASQRASRDTNRYPTNLPPVSGKVAKVIQFAQAQLGKPYQWGADGPGSYDCSGLTMMAWRQAGVSLPHSSQQQYNSAPHVPKSQIQPGDLLFFYQPISHVAIYVGNGKMIAAPQSGDVVKYEDYSNSYYQSNYTGAVRPG